MNILYTIGCNGIPEPEEMAVALREHGVEVLVDIRIRPYGRKVLFNKKKLEDVQGPMKLTGMGLSSYRRTGKRGQERRSDPTQG